MTRKKGLTLLRKATLAAHQGGRDLLRRLLELPLQLDLLDRLVVQQVGTSKRSSVHAKALDRSYRNRVTPVLEGKSHVNHLKELILKGEIHVNHLKEVILKGK